MSSIVQNHSFRSVQIRSFIRFVRSFNSFDLLHVYTRIYAPARVPIYIAVWSFWAPGRIAPRNAAGTDHRNGKNTTTKKNQKKVKKNL